MRISDFDYALPPELIAQRPVEKRDESRLMVVERQTGSLRHMRFRDLERFLSPADLLVLNNTRVFPARLYGRRNGYSESIEVLLLRRCEGDIWEALVRPGKKAKPGQRLVFDDDGRFEAVVLNSLPEGARELRFEYDGEFWDWIERCGKTPLPPYIRRQVQEPEESDRRRYQTVFARVTGSIAAPTAGLHFTAEMLDRLPHCEITLHVGYGTFKPVRAEQVEEHRIQPEFYEVASEAAERLNRSRAAGGRMIAVGTTTTRVLEHLMARHGEIKAECGWTDLFIYPGFSFKAVDALVTNFHLPKSTLLLLVCAFAGKELIDKAYQEAIQQGYRFYSYGDAMLIL